MFRRLFPLFASLVLFGHLPLHAATDRALPDRILIRLAPEFAGLDPDFVRQDIIDPLLTADRYPVVEVRPTFPNAKAPVPEFYVAPDGSTRPTPDLRAYYTIRISPEFRDPLYHEIERLIASDTERRYEIRGVSLDWVNILRRPEVTVEPATGGASRPPAPPSEPCSAASLNDPKIADGTLWYAETAELACAWNVEYGQPTVKVAIVESGCNAGHIDLRDNLSEESGDTIELTEEEIADLEAQGYTLLTDANGENDPDCGGAYDNPGCQHNTGTLGTAIATGNNGEGAAGVCPGCKGLAIRTSYFAKDERGNIEEFGTFEQLLDGFVYAADHGAVSLNMSFCLNCGCSTQACDDQVKEMTEPVLEAVWAAGVVLTGSAGNGGSGIVYPGSSEFVIAVAGTSSSFSPCATTTNIHVPVAGPACNVFTPWPSTSDPDGYASVSGTSFSSPYLAGLAGLIASRNPTLTNVEIRAILENSVDPIVNFDTRRGPRYYGHGTSNAFEAVSVTRVPTVRIESPTHGSTLSATDDVEVRGTILKDEGASSLSWRLELGESYYPDDDAWEVIASGSGEVESGVLGTLAYPGADGDYTLRLVAEEAGSVMYAYASVIYSTGSGGVCAGSILPPHARSGAALLFGSLLLATLLLRAILSAAWRPRA